MYCTDIKMKNQDFWDMTLRRLVTVTDVSEKYPTAICRVVKTQSKILTLVCFRVQAVEHR
jgi:hypothetical protein